MRKSGGKKLGTLFARIERGVNEARKRDGLRCAATDARCTARLLALFVGVWSTLLIKLRLSSAGLGMQRHSCGRSQPVACSCCRIRCPAPPHVSLASV